MMEIAHQNKESAQLAQKTWYDRAARDRSFQVGDKVLILLPSSAAKLQAKWQGPAVVTRKISDLDYEVDFGKRKPKKIYHVNMLRKWHERKLDSFLAARVERVNDLDEQTKLPDVSDSNQTWQDVEISGKLTDEQRQSLSTLLHEYSSVLSSEPGCTDVITHSVLTTDEIPVRQRPYRIPQAMRNIVKSEIDKMLKSGYIEPANSPYASPIVMVKKADSTWRFCIDYRRLNAKTLFDPQPMPRVDELIEKVSDAKYISTIDLAKGYWQIRLDDDAKQKSAFVTPFGCYRFCVMPFGMVCAGATFMRLMNAVLNGAESYASSYIDDIVVHSDTFEEHCIHLRDVLDRLSKAGLTAKPSKCSLAVAEAHYLGYVIGHGKLKPELAKVKAVLEYPRPVTKRDVRSFFGLCGYYRRFMPNFAQIAVSLTDLTKKKIPLIVPWTVTCEKSFQELKKILSSSPVLRAPDYSLPFVVQVDACDSGIGVVLSQVSGGVEYPVCYLSRKLLPRECNYSTIEKECLALVWGIQTLDPYLFGRAFVVQSDHNPMRWLMSVKAKNQRLLRWSLVLQEYRFQVLHRKGSENGNADALSRAFM